MVESEKIYQSILLRLSSIPIDYLDQVDYYLQKFSQNLEQKKQNKVEIMSLAVSWDDMSEQDFDEFLGVLLPSG